MHESLLLLPLLPKRVLGRVRISERVPLADAMSARQLLVGASAAMVQELEFGNRRCLRLINGKIV